MLRCATGHDFDIARQGYVNLTPSRAAKKSPDTTEMVAARERFLEAGFYRPLSDWIAAAVSDTLAQLDEGHRNVLDVGCGPGFYLERIHGYDRIWGGGIVEGVAGVDLSKPAIRRAAKVLRGELFAVADVQEGIPVTDASFGAVVSVFAPRPVPELRRVVRSGGGVVLAAAGPDHLRELRNELGLLGVPEDKEEVLARQLSGHFDIGRIERLTSTVHLEEHHARDLVAMGPNFWHRTGSSSAPVATDVTTDFLVLRATPK